jgi:hypothetical protein
MAWVGANDVHATFTANDLTVFADPFNACADFHRSCSQNSGFIKARQYRNESHIPTRAIFLGNTFFVSGTVRNGSQLALPQHQSALIYTRWWQFEPRTNVSHSKSDASAFCDRCLNPGLGASAIVGDLPALGAYLSRFVGRTAQAFPNGAGADTRHS